MSNGQFMVLISFSKPVLYSSIKHETNMHNSMRMRNDKADKKQSKSGNYLFVTSTTMNT